MRARACVLAALTVCAPAAAFADEPKPKPIDAKPFRDKLIVLQDAAGGTYVVLPGDSPRAWYGPGKQLYEQVVIGRSADGETGAWTVDVWAPRVPNLEPGAIVHKADGNYERVCGTRSDEGRAPLAQLTGDKAKAALDKVTLMTTALIRKPYVLARDDSGVYYYVDVIRRDFGGNGHRVFVGKKGAMKQMPLVDVASDSAGDVFSTKTGDLRLVTQNGDSSKRDVAWVRGEKKTALVTLDVDVNSPLIFRDLGVYTFVGALCENL